MIMVSDEIYEMLDYKMNSSNYRAEFPSTLFYKIHRDLSEEYILFGLIYSTDATSQLPKLKNPKINNQEPFFAAINLTHPAVSSI